MDQGLWHCSIDICSKPDSTSIFPSLLSACNCTALCKHNIPCAQKPDPVPIQVALFCWAKSYQWYQLDLYKIFIPLSDLLWNVTVSALMIPWIFCLLGSELEKEWNLYPGNLLFRRQTDRTQSHHCHRNQRTVPCGGGRGCDSCPSRGPVWDFIDTGWACGG